jgi:hypothetical protein
MKIQRRTFLMGACGSVVAASVRAQENPDRAYLALWATTQSMSIPGLPGLPEGFKLEDLPPEAAAALAGLAGRKELEVRLWSAGAAPAGASASLEIPAGLALGKSLPLEIMRPEARKAEVEKIKIPEEYRITDDFEIRQYWGCSETVLPGQPKVWKLGNLPPAEREVWKRYSAGGLGVLEKPDWTEAHWPNSKADAGRNPLMKVGSLKGPHRLRTSYLGEASFTVDSPVDFLDPVTFSSPKPGKPDLKAFIPVAWKPIPNALGYHLLAIAPKGRKLLIMWSAGKNAEGMVAGGQQFPQMAEVRSLVEKGVYLPGTATSCNIPAGIFEGCDNVMLTMTAYGPGQAFDAPNAPAIRVQTRSVGMMTLGTPRLPGRD